MTPRRPWWATTAILTVVVVAATGCSDDEPASGDRTTSTSSSSTAPPTTTEPPGPTTSEPTEPSPSPQPTQSPTATETGPPLATGPRLMVGPLTLRVPQGWRKMRSQSPFDVSAKGGEGVQGNVVVLVTFPIIVGRATLDELAREALESSSPRGQVLDPVVLGGVEMAHVRGSYGGVLSDKYLADVDGDLITITIGYDNGIEGDRAAQRTLLDQVLPTVRWSRR